MIIDSPIFSGSYVATGSLNQIGNVTITGSLTVTGTINASITGSITTASYASNAELLDGLDSTSFTTTSSFNTASGSFSTRVASLENFSSSLDATFATDAQLTALSQSFSSSLSTVSGSLSSRITNNEVTGSNLTIASGSFSTRVTNTEATASNLVLASGSFSTRTTNLELASGSFSTRVTDLETASGSFSTRVTTAENNITNLQNASSSFSTRVTSAENSIVSIQGATGSYATTGSNNFNGNQVITGSLTTTGTIVAQTLNVQQVTSSIVYSSGSNIFGNSVSNTQQFTGSLQVSSSTSYILGNVGIGTTSPTRIFTINGGSSSSRVLLQNTSSGFTIGNGFDIVLDNSGNTQVWNYQNGVMQFATNNTERMRLDAGGNVGIGTTSPGVKLDIFGGQARVSGSTNEQLVLDYATAVGSFSWQSFRINGTNKYRFVGDVNNGFGIYSDILSAYALAISASGNVGIGTTSPTRKLDVNGTSIFRDFTTVVASNGNAVSNITWLSTDSGIMNIYTGGSAAVQLNSNGVSYFNGGNVGMGTTSPALKLDIVDNGAKTAGIDEAIIRIRSTDQYGASIHMSGSSNWRILSTGPSSTPGGGDLGFYSDNGSSYRMLIQGSDGNVGIGTTNPAAKLHISGDVYSTSNINSARQVRAQGWYDVGANHATEIGVFSGVGYLISYDRTATIYKPFEIDATNITLAAQGANYVNVTTNGSERMRIDSGGNVGIGTTNPSVELHLKDSNKNPSIRIDHSGGGSTFMKFQQFAGWNNSMTFTSAAAYMGIDVTIPLILNQSGGSVGIGTTSPSYKLDTRGTGTILGIVSTDGTPTRLIIQRSTVPVYLTDMYTAATTAGASWSINKADTSAGSSTWAASANTAYSAAAIRLNSDTSTSYITFLTANAANTDPSEVVRITGAGNVGIGTTAPNGKLHVYESATGGTIRIGGGNGASNSRIFIQANGNNSYIDSYGDNGYKPLSIVASPISLTGGNVGIGLNDPLATLATLGGTVQIMGDYRNHATIIRSAGANGTFNGSLVITIPEMSNANADGYGGYSCEVYVAGYSGFYCHAWFGGYINGGIVASEATILRSNGGWSISQTSYGTYNQGFQFTIDYPSSIVHPTARIIFNKGGSPNATAYPANSITTVFS